jgi:hypothetical protein
VDLPCFAIDENVLTHVDSRLAVAKGSGAVSSQHPGHGGDGEATAQIASLTEQVRALQQQQLEAKHG